MPSKAWVMAPAGDLISRDPIPGDLFLGHPISRVCCDCVTRTFTRLIRGVMRAISAFSSPSRNARETSNDADELATDSVSVPWPSPSIVA